MALADVKNRIKTQLEAVAGIGKVYTRLLYAREEKDIAAKLVQSGRLNVWLITRELANLRDENLNQSLSEQRDQIVVHGFYALDDDDTNPSEASFDALVDAILDKLNTDRRPPSKFGGMVQSSDPPFLRLSDQRMYGPTQALCHHAEIVLPVVWRYLQ